jgi:hypothetical protein
VENLGASSSDFLRVELKQVPLGAMQPFRGKAPSLLLRNSQAIEFKSPEVTVQRILCVAGTCEGFDSSAPSLLIAFSRLNLTGADALRKDRLMKDGDIVWEPAQQSISVTATSVAPAHLLRIIFTSPQKNSTVTP